MNEYEITYIISTKAGEEGRDAVNAEVEKKIADMEGKVEHASAALREQLAYPVHGNTAGFVRVVNITLDPSEAAKLNTFFKKHKDVLRYTILSTPRREALPGDLLQKLSDETNKARDAKRAEAAEEKEVTMQDVEKGIEEALSEDID